jgi:protein-L-isoaspartate(D-aspartate) O-methyltransferase
MIPVERWSELDQGSTARDRDMMVSRQIRGRGVKDERVLDAMGKVPRHFFVPSSAFGASYADHPLEIGAGQTISQPLMVATMLELLELSGDERVLEIGTGSGYQTAVLALLVERVYTVEFRAILLETAETRISRLGIMNVSTECGDGSEGWFEHAPYDSIIVSAGAPQVPELLKHQLSDGGRLVIPVGARDLQHLLMIRRDGDSFDQTQHGSCLFVPLIGNAGWQE